MANLTAGELQILVDVQTGEIDKLKAKLNGLDKQTKKNNFSIGKLAASFGVADLAVKVATAAISKAAQTIKKGINLARDLEESNNKLRVTFRGIEQDALRARDALVSSYGLSTNEATELLGATGDLLTGFGFQRKEALKLSESVQQLAVDLASFQNLEGGAQRASEALTKALLGETESAKALGIVIRQNTPEFREQVETLMETQGVTEQVAKAQVIYQQAVRQSQNAIGDFDRTSDSLSNRQRTLKAVQNDVAASLGSVFIPQLRAGTGAVLDITTAVRDWLKEEKNLKGFQTAIQTLSFAFFILLKSIQLNFKLMLDFLKLFPLGVTAVKELFQAILDPKKKVSDVFKGLGDDLVDLGKSYVEFGKEIGDTFADTFLSNKEDISDALGDIAGEIETSGGKAAQKFKNIFGEEIEMSAQRTFDNILSGVKDTFGAIGDIVSAVGDIISNQNETALQELEQRHEMEIEAIDERLAREIELIENNGMTKQEARQLELDQITQALQTETDATKRKDLEEKQSALQKEIAIAKLEDDAQKQREKLEKKAAKKKYQLELSQFQTKKGTEAANAGINFASGIVGLWGQAFQNFPPPVAAAIAGIFSGIYTGVFAAQLAAILSKSPPPPPKFAQGGIASGPFIAGEAGQELIVPEGASSRSRVYNARDTKTLTDQPVMVNAMFMIGDEEVPINRVLISNRQRNGAII